VKTDHVCYQSPNPKEIARLKAIMAAIGPALARFKDQAYLTAIFLGTQPLEEGDAGLLIEFSESIADHCRPYVDPRDGVEARAAQAKDQLLLALAESPDKLLLLLRYQTRLERRIEKTIKDLRRRK